MAFGLPQHGKHADRPANWPWLGKYPRHTDYRPEAGVRSKGKVKVVASRAKGPGLVSGLLKCFSLHVVKEKGKN